MAKKWGTWKMGRQIAIVADWPDELALLEYLAAGGDVRVFRRFAESQDALWINDWRTHPIADDSYGIWPSRFHWTPRPARMLEPCVAEAKGKWWFENAATGPAILLSRHLYGRTSTGRLYWSKRLLELARGPLEYDVESFDRQVNGLWRWIRKHGVRDVHTPGKPYILPSAFRRRVDDIE